MDYLSRHGDGLAFQKYFWKKCEPNANEKRVYSRYVQAIQLQQRGQADNRISKEIKVTPSSVRNWLQGVTKPKLVRYLEAYLQHGKPRDGWVWLSINNAAFHASPQGPFIEVPIVITKWQDVLVVIKQLGSYGLRGSRQRVYELGFLMGILIGDAAKKRQYKWHRHIELVLSKKYKTNLRIGTFTCECAQALGLRMVRRPDLAAHGGKPNGFYVWTSQSSPLVDWMFNICLGLKDNELTTYNPVRMEWALTAPRAFRQGLVQGIAESDGSVSIASQTVEFWIGPNWTFMKRLLLTFGVRSFRSRLALSVSKREIDRIRLIPPFAPHLGTVRHHKFERLAAARHIGHGKRIPRAIREAISNESQRGLSAPRISEEILSKFGILVSFEGIQRWARRVRSRGLVQQLRHQGQTKIGGQD